MFSVLIILPTRPQPRVDAFKADELLELLANAAASNFQTVYPNEVKMDNQVKLESLYISTLLSSSHFVFFTHLLSYLICVYVVRTFLVDS